MLGMTATLLMLIALPLAAQEPVVLDDFSNPASWTAAPSDGVALTLAADDGARGTALRMDIDFQGTGGYAVIRKTFDLALPENYEFTVRIRGDVPQNNLEFKLVDASGDNVWWVNRRNFEFRDDWQLVRIPKRAISFAWGPLGGGEMRRLAAIEFAVTAGSGGKGSVWLDELTFREKPPDRPYDLRPAASATTASGSADLILDGDPSTSWRTKAGGPQSITLDFLREREYGGAVIDWGTPYASGYEVQISNDGREWTTLREVRGGNGGRDYLFLPEAQSRWLRLRFRTSSGSGYEIRDIGIEPLSFADSKDELFRRMAADSVHGSYPKYLDGVQSYWTIAGAPADEQEILINEEGMIEVGGVGGFSIEPFLRTGPDTFLTWADVETSQSLADGVLPIPSVTWTHSGIQLSITALAGGDPGRSAARAVYLVTNRGTTTLEATLFVAIRPFQVNPPWQFLNVPGGHAPIRTIDYENGAARINGDRILTPDPSAQWFGAVAFDSGSIVESLRDRKLPARQSISDPFGAASAAFAWDLRLAAGATRENAIEVPLHSGAPPAPPAEEIRRAWKEIVDETVIDLPPSAREIEETLKSNLAYILVNQDEAAIQPGSRAYDRSWIRDGSLTSAALLRLGATDAVRRFIEWYAPFQYANGKVPCCVDDRGAGPVPENDSHGQLIFVIAEYVRQTGELDLARELWPHIVAAVDYMEVLRAQRMTDEYRTPEKLAYFGLLPESISHEGYSAKPMHSYWDQFFALKGYKDAAWLASELVRETCASARPMRSPAEATDASCGMFEQKRARYAALRDAFRKDLLASIERAMAMHGIDYIPGAVELGDFDATSTTIAIDPVGELANLPRAALERTFEKYWENFVARRDGEIEWEGYTPYELRVVGTFIQLGWIERAHEALAWFMDHRRPAAWNHWAEVVFRDPALPKFIGDMPHTWVGSDFIRSLLDFFAYERESDEALVIGAGVPEAWAREGLTVTNLRTHYGPLSYSIRPADDGTIVVSIGAGVELPRGGIVVQLPFAEEPSVVRSLPAEVRITPTGGSR